jgi:uncharacterized protein
MEPLISQTINFVKHTLAGAETGHDWFHIERVYKTALTINSIEKGDPLIVSLAALLHDIADSKFHDGDEEIGPRKAGEFMTSIGVEPIIIKEVQAIIKKSFFQSKF